MRAWLAERAAARRDRGGDRAQDGPAAPAIRLWYYLGGMTLFFFGVQVVTGILLLLYYRPSAAEAYESVAVHHDARAVRLAGPIDPRLVGQPDGRRGVRAPVQRHLPARLPAAARAHVDVAACCSCSSRSASASRGYLLPWNELAFFATRVGHGHRGRRAGHRRLHRAASCAAART